MRTVTIPLEDYERLQEQLQEYKDNYAYSNVHTYANGHYVYKSSFFRSKEDLDAELTDEIKMLEKQVEERKELANRLRKELREIKDTVNCSKRLFGYRLVREKHLG